MLGSVRFGYGGLGYGILGWVSLGFSHSLLLGFIGIQPELSSPF